MQLKIFKRCTHIYTQHAYIHEFLYTFRTFFLSFVIQIRII